MPRPSRVSLLLALVCFSATGCGRFFQQVTLLSQARSRYYNLAASGVSEYHCDALPDWDAFLTSVNGHPPDDTPWHRYLRSAHLSFSAPLNADPKVQWIDPLTPPAASAKSAADMKDSFQKVLEDFLEAWRINLDGTLLPEGPFSDIAPAGAGYTLSEHDAQDRISTITMDKTMRITHLSTHGPNTTAEIDTEYGASPSGLMLLSMDSRTHSPPSAPELHTVMRTTYAEVRGHRTPASLLVISSSGTRIPMRFTHCDIRP